MTEPNDMTVISSHFHKLQTAIDFAHHSHLVTVQNLANANTPNFKTKQVSFGQLLARLDGAASAGLEGTFKLEDVEGLDERSDGNNVDLDREIATLKTNALAYQTLTQLLGSQMGILQRAISG